MVYTGNLVHGLLRAEVAPKAAGRAYWIADAEPYELRTVFETVRDALEAEGFVPDAFAPFAEALAEGDGVTAAAGDVFGEVIADNLSACRLAVNEQAKAGGAARTVIRDGDVDPFVDGERIGGADRNRVAGPEVNERPFGAAVFEEEFVAAAAGVGPGTRAVEDDGALFGIGSLNPEGNCERFVALKITELGLDGVVTGKANGGTSAGTAGDGCVFLGSRSVVVGLQSVREAPGAG